MIDVSRWRLIDNWQRTLTHGYASWCIYLSLAVNWLADNLSSFSDYIPGWASLAVLAAALVLRVVKQPVVSGAPDEPA